MTRVRGICRLLCLRRLFVLGMVLGFVAATLMVDLWPREAEDYSRTSSSRSPAHPPVDEPPVAADLDPRHLPPDAGGRRKGPSITHPHVGLHPNLLLSHPLPPLHPPSSIFSPLHEGCPEEGRPIHVVALVLSSPTNHDRRHTIRSTWMQQRATVGHSATAGTSSNNNKQQLRLTSRFLLGTKDMDPNTLNTLQREQDMFQDILLIPQIADSYYQLSEKVLYGIRWTSGLEFDYLLKTDDDSYVRVPKLVKALRHRGCPRSLYWGYFMGFAKPLYTGKWKEPDWFLCPNYLPYAMGGGYILSEDVVRVLGKLADRLKLYRNEDVNMATLLAPYRLWRWHDLRFNVESVSRGCSERYIITHKEKVKALLARHSRLMATANGSMCEREEELHAAYVYNWTALPTQCCQKIRNLTIPDDDP